MEKSSEKFSRRSPRRISGLFPVLLAGFLLFALCGCSLQSDSSSAENTPEESATQEVYAMDTYMTLTANGESANAAVSAAAQKLYELDAELSATDENSQIYALNHRLSDRVSGDAAAVLSASIRLSALTEHCFDISSIRSSAPGDFRHGNTVFPLRRKSTDFSLIPAWKASPSTHPAVR